MPPAAVAADLDAAFLAQQLGQHGTAETPSTRLAADAYERAATLLGGRRDSRAATVELVHALAPPPQGRLFDLTA